MDGISHVIITTTEMNEVDPDLYASVINGLYFQLNHQRDNSTLVLSVGATDISENQRSALEQAYKDAGLPGEKGPQFFKHNVSLIIPLDEQWTVQIKSAIQMLINWAKTNDVHGGCYMCGVDNPSVFYREVEEESTYLCDECEILIIEKSAASKAEADSQSDPAPIPEKRLIGLLFAVPARILQSVLFISLYFSVIPKLLGSGPTFLILTFAFMFGIFPFLAYIETFHIYKKVAKNFSSTSLDILTIINIIICLFDATAVLSLLTAAFKKTGESALTIFCNFIQHGDVIALEEMGMWIFLFPLAGIFFAHFRIWFNHRDTFAQR